MLPLLLKEARKKRVGPVVAGAASAYSPAPKNAPAAKVPVLAGLYAGYKAGPKAGAKMIARGAGEGLALGALPPLARMVASGVANRRISLEDLVQAVKGIGQDKLSAGLQTAGLVHGGFASARNTNKDTFNERLGEFFSRATRLGRT